MNWDDATYSGDAYPCYGWSCSVVDLDVDLDTGEVLYRRYVGSTDVARPSTRDRGRTARGRRHPSARLRTCEEVVVDDHGRMINDRLTNYIIPTALDAPEMITRIVEIPFAGGPFGAKGVGEIPMDGPAPAVAQAIEAATGVVLDTLPMTPERIIDAMDGAQ